MEMLCRLVVEITTTSFIYISGVCVVNISLTLLWRRPQS